MGDNLFDPDAAHQEAMTKLEQAMGLSGALPPQEANELQNADASRRRGFWTGQQHMVEVYEEAFPRLNNSVDLPDVTK